MLRFNLRSSCSTLLLAFVFLLQLQAVMAQFESFFNMFGGQQQQQQQQQQQRSAASQFSAYIDTVSCAHYLCPLTLDCVQRPSDCPCPNAEDIKCLIPDMDGDVDDATVMCVRGKQECAEVERLMRKHSDKKRK
ncbi:hypothetical protein P691DRAFT_793463 [Macrolepiota fuliginosa MF-IS2]|uniref:Long chronological lifespan protein 2 n=1 Tax=Macrolepiota fuliginosa MF-IS2 TaxID=1400762 RepID=A0A9P6C5Y9_9AGAR|nr:hypothetical protein P691DRAFT_793463 [Macrolepiota fuliginosa MF-IS2]